MGTVKDVANVAGVSTSTVSHVINGTRYVSPDLQQRVLAAISTTGYVRDSVARALRRSRTDTIGVAIAELTDPFFAGVIQGMQAEAQSLGLLLLLATASESVALEERAIVEFLERRVDGLLVAPTARRSKDVVARRLVGGRVPGVLVDQLLDPRLDQVGSENINATAALVTHLAIHGHRRIGFVAGSSQSLNYEERLMGYRRGLARAGLRYDPEYVAIASQESSSGRDAVLYLVDHGVRALVTASDGVTVATLMALASAGLEVPRDIAIAAFDDLPWAVPLRPGLTCMRQRSNEIGKLGVRLLHRRLEDPNLPTRTIRLRPDLLIRESCGCPYRRADDTDPDLARGQGQAPVRQVPVESKVPARGGSPTVIGVKPASRRVRHALGGLDASAELGLLDALAVTAGVTG